MVFTINAFIGCSRWFMGLSTGYDLAIFEQSAKTWWQLDPVSHYRGLPLLGDHFSPILAVMALPWRVAPSGLTLVLTQSVLFAGAAFVVVRYAVRVLPPGPALTFVLFGAPCSFALLAASARDVHEIEFGVPLIALALVAVLDRRRGLLVTCCLGLLLVKEDLGLTVAALGLAWFVRYRDRRLAVVLGVVGALGVVVSLWIIGQVNGGGGSIYLSYFGLAEPTAAASISATQRTMPQVYRLIPIALFAVTCGWWGLRSSLALVALPTLAWRVTSSHVNYWLPFYHYDAMLWPVAVLAFVDVARRGGIRTDGWRRVLLPASLAVSLGICGVVTWGRVWPWGSTQRVTNLEQAAARLPRGTPIQADEATAAYLVERLDVHALGETTTPVSALVFVPGGSRLAQPSACSMKRFLIGAGAQVHVETFGDVTLVTFPGGAQLPHFPAC